MMTEIHCITQRTLRMVDIRPQGATRHQGATQHQGAIRPQGAIHPPMGHLEGITHSQVDTHHLEATQNPGTMSLQNL